MKRTQSQIDDSIVVQHLDALRFAAGLNADVQRELKQLAAKIRRILAENELRDASRAQAERVIKELGDAIVLTHSRIVGRQLTALDGFAGVMQRAVSIALGSLPEVARFSAKNALLSGATLSEVWTTQGAAVQRQVSREVRMAALDKSVSSREVLSRIVGDKKAKGVLDRAASQSKALTEGVTLAVQSQAKLTLLESADDLLAGWRWSARFDSKTCLTCAGLDGKLFSLTGEPIGHSTPFDGGAPRHIGCRCVLVPELNLSGVGAPRPGPDGAINRGPTFEDWISKKSDRFKNEYFGPGRLELWKAENLTFSDLLDMQGRPLTLEALRKKYGSSPA